MSIRRDTADSNDAVSAAQPSVFGPFDVQHGADFLTLRLANRGEFSFNGCVAFAFTLMCVLVLGVLGVVQMAYAPNAPQTSVDAPGRFFAPKQNHFGFLWLFASGLLLVLMPLYIRRAYRASVEFTFRRSDNAFLRDNRLVTRLRQIEYLSVLETHDPDNRYLYLLDLVYGDGRTLNLHSDYDERAVLNLANEIASFVGTRVEWRDAGSTRSSLP